MSKNKFEVDLARVHKALPFNCCGYIPEIFAQKIEDVIDLPEVQKLINETYGRRFIVTVSLVAKPTTCFRQYNVFKHRAKKEFQYKNKI